MATLPLKYCPRLISICNVRLVGKHIFFDWCIPQAAFSDSAVSWLLLFIYFFSSPPPPLLLFGPSVTEILTRRAQSQGLCWRPEPFPLLAQLLAGSPCWSERPRLCHLMEAGNHVFTPFFPVSEQNVLLIFTVFSASANMLTLAGSCSSPHILSFSPAPSLCGSFSQAIDSKLSYEKSCLNIYI